MKNVVVDTNILFSALGSVNTKVRDILLDSTDIGFYAPNFVVTEIFKHKEKILQKSKIDEDELYEILTNLLYVIQFVNEKLVSTSCIIEAYKLCNDIDPKDTPFVALTLELEGLLWTRDEVLKQGLTKKGFLHFFEL